MKDFRPQGWDSEAFCSNLCLAKSAELDCIPNIECKLEIINCVAKWQRTASKAKLQTSVAKTLLSHMQETWKSLLRRRMESLLPLRDREAAFEAIASIDQKFVHTGICKLPGYTSTVAMCVLKTWTNSWATTERFHESEILPCIFGCAQRDSLSHYLTCEPFWTAVHCCTSASLRECEFPLVVRIGLASPTLRRLRRLAVAFGTYHNIKLKHRDIIVQAKSEDDWTTVHDKLFETARAYALEHSLLH